ncbi:DEAD/DEAH box helicase family protein [Microbacterium sp. H1-D42]|uniref:DEAD/DEAH box helicase family protein n=1 Tax=Microbacterium sp. H1-D42 TaxID=2925844 RepID=UPI001F53290F|nr:DEAD/DEAH box helicase family protein [Microbacterium sp. H1-D42]UNK71697.1 DEAD/DEAH box helicase family protein [Microbacterium sp. H1-D42]
MSSPADRPAATRLLNTHPLATRPFTGWRFDGDLRRYQQEVLAQIPAGSDVRSMHIVAPPGSGKTLLGLLLAAREGRRTLVLAPTTTIRQQWVQTARRLASSDADVSDDPTDLADLTVLTYQLLSVTGDGSPFDELARGQWVDELTAAGRSEAEAATWLAQLAVDNPKQFAKGILRRGRAYRRRFVQERPDALARVLHPNAVALIDRLVASGVDTIVLDECHHLLDHWAIVVSYLAARIREHGGRALLIGLTATLPSPDDGDEFENYSQLLGDVDYEVPTPAVVKEGHLAPYRDLIWFTEPVLQEAQFIRRHEDQLHDMMLQVLASPDGLRYLRDQLQPADDDPRPAEDDDPGVAEDADEAHRLGIDRALSADFALARACGVVLRAVAPQHPLSALLNPQTFGRVTTDDLLTVLARFSLTRLLPDPAAHEQWRYVKHALADFGLHLTDRGIRRGRNPIEVTLATSIAKDHAAVDILHRELRGADAEHVRAVVVTDAVESGNHRGLRGSAAPGALRVFDLLAHDPVTAALSPVLLTGAHLRTTAADATAIAHALEGHLGAPFEIADGVGPTRELRAAGIGGGRLVGAVSHLIADGRVRLLVGTRGLLGEGWDCPAVNTLIDLTTVATSAGSQQLRGRTLRLDPAWEQKVAHNWSVACLIPPSVDLDDTTEVARLRRRHSHLWGLSADDGTSVITGLGAALDRAALERLDGVLAKAEGAAIDMLNAAALQQFRDRADTRAAWRIGAPYVAQERETVSVRAAARSAVLTGRRRVAAPAAVTFTTVSLGVGVAASAVGAALELGVPLGVTTAAALAAGAATTLIRWGGGMSRALRRRRDPASGYRAAARAVSRALQDAGRIRALPDEAIQVQQTADEGKSGFRVTVRGPSHDCRLIADAVEELFGAARTPRFLLAIDAAPSVPPGRRIRRTKRTPLLLPVPQLIARRRADAEHFAAQWNEHVGRGALIELQGEEGLQLLRLARAQPGQLDAGAPRATLWG